MSRRVFLLASFMLVACDYGLGSLLDTGSDQPDPGGTIAVSINAGTMRISSGFADHKADPMTIQGTSGELTFALTAGDDLSGATAKSLLANAGGSTQLPLTETSRTALEVHLEGTGCIATAGTIRLTVNEKNKISGSFEATGARPDGSECKLDGTLTDVPGKK